MASLRREKTIVLALLIQLFVAAFSSFLVVGLTSLYDPTSIGGAEVDLGISGEAQDELISVTAETEGVRAIRFGSASDARSAFDAGRVDGILTASRVPGPGGGTRIHVIGTAPQGNIETSMVVVQIRRLLSQLERTERIERAGDLTDPPLEVPERGEASSYFGFTYTILVPLLLFLPAFISGSVAVDVITEEIERGTLELLRVAPISLVSIIEGKALGLIAIAPLQAILWLALLAINGIAIHNWVPLLGFVAASAAVLTALGIGLGLLVGTRRHAQILYSVLAISLFGSAVLLPEHPATTAAKYSVGSATWVSASHLLGSICLAVGSLLLVRLVASRTEPSRL